MNNIVHASPFLDLQTLAKWMAACLACSSEGRIVGGWAGARTQLWMVYGQVWHQASRVGPGLPNFQTNLPWRCQSKDALSSAKSAWKRPGTWIF